jgi:hypothetical protein
VAGLPGLQCSVDGERHSAGWEIIRLGDRCGGFGGFLVQTINWAPRDQMLRSDGLPARYVMPQFQGAALGTAASNTWAYERRETLTAGRTRAIERAREDYAPRHAWQSVVGLCMPWTLVPVSQRQRVLPQSVHLTTRPSMNDTVHSLVPASSLPRPPSRSTTLGRPS